MEEIDTGRIELGTKYYSILIPIYNGMNYLDSLLRQLKNIPLEGVEIVIVNDGSTDINEQDLADFFQILPNCKVVTKNHTGLVDSLNIGIQNCTNEFVARLDVDDEFVSTRFITQYDYLSKNNDCSAVFCDYEIISPSGKSLGLIPSAVFPDLVKLSLLNPQRTPHPGVMFRKSRISAIGGYRLEDFPAEDLGLWIRLLEFGTIASVPSMLLRYKLNSTGISSTKRLEMKLKTSHLLEAYSKSISNEEFIENAMQCLSDYKHYSQREIREILALRDFLKLLYLGRLNFGYKLRILIKILAKLLRIRLIFCCIVLFIQAAKRHAIRKRFLG
jgi:glycosyltransferase involved in cell wall biosynthesis